MPCGAMIWRDDMAEFSEHAASVLLTRGGETWRADGITSGCSFNYRQEHQSLLEKLSALEKKVIVGGVDLLAKAEEQEKLLEESNMELEERRKRAEQLRKELEEKEVTPC